MGDTETITTLLMPISKDLEMSRARSVSCRHCPALQDIDGDIASVLSRSIGKSLEEIVADLTNVASLAELQEARTVIFTYAIGAVIESDDSQNICRLKQRRGTKAAVTIAMDITRLFNYLCEASCHFPTSVLASHNLLNDRTGMMSTVTVPPPAHISTPPAALGPDHEPATPTPSPDDLPCGQRSHTTSSPAVPDDRSPIGSPFLTDREPSSVQAPSQLLSPIMLNMISSDTSVLICDDSPGSNTCGDSQTIGAPAACCDHGRAIIDLRYTVDKMQFQIIELQRQLSNFSRGEPAVPAQARSGEIDVPTSPYNAILPSPPDSQLSNTADSDSSTMLTDGSFSEILSIATPNKLGDTTQPRSQLSATVRDRDSVPAHGAGDATPGSTPGANKRTDSLAPNFNLVQDELESLRTRLIDIEDRVSDNEMRLGIQNDELDALKDLPNSTAILKRAVETVSVSSEKNKKRIKKLCKNRSKSGKGETKIVANVETSNRFAPLAHACTDNDPKSHHTKSAKPKCHTRVKQTRKTKSQRNVNDNKKRKLVKIIGASMVRGQGKLVTDKTQGISACCFPCPGAKAEGIQKRLSGMVSKRDDAIVVLGGTNNVPADEVGTCIRRIGNLIKEVSEVNQTAQIIVSEIPIRFDEVSLNQNIEKINIFIRHVCTKSDRMHSMNLDHFSRSHFARDGLHFSEKGKLCFAKAIKKKLVQISPSVR